MNNSKLKAIRDSCKKELRDSEPWPGYFDRRYWEFLNYIPELSKNKHNKILELGCGTGYYSAFLSEFSDTVIATDLEIYDPATHTLGLDVARGLIESLNIENVEILPASVEKLPFDDNTFDFVFSSHVLEHVPDINQGISEIKRVLRPGGINFCVMPTVANRIYSWPLHYVYLFKRVLSRLFNPSGENKKQDVLQNLADTTEDNAVERVWGYFPFMPPHGVLDSFMQELSQWRVSKWKKKLSSIGRVTHFRTIQLNPLFLLLADFFPRFSNVFYSLIRPFGILFGRIPILKHLGNAMIIITRKEDK